MVLLRYPSAAVQVKGTNDFFRLYTWTSRVPGQTVGRDQETMAKYTYSDIRNADGGATVKVNYVIGYIAKFTRKQ